MFQLQDLEGFLKIFTFDRKKDLDRYCREVVVHSQDFAAFVVSCDGGRMPFQHRIHYRDYVPEHLVPSEPGLGALAHNGVGPLQGDALKMVRKLGQLFRERRYLVGHMFFTPDLHEWHFFYFDQRDLEDERPNHWKGGSHVHFINWLWPEHDAQSLWSRFVSADVQLGGSFHIKFVRDELTNQVDNQDLVF
jgi:hypothetical protein